MDLRHFICLVLGFRLLLHVCLLVKRFFRGSLDPLPLSNVPSVLGNICGAVEYALELFIVVAFMGLAFGPVISSYFQLK
jgi:hypothetical protein